ncbi:MAG: hypothetical protein LW854_22255 [Rubrivivax sp.]|jgi:hypothetical protein|nr:hypothetical protein [Rubrivivax sp.]
MIHKLIQRVLRRKLAYRRTFMDAEGRLHPSAEIVLADLRRFCRATGSTMVLSPVSKTIDPLAMAMAEGRREVWMRLMAHLHVDEKQVFNLVEPSEGERNDDV